MIEMGPYFKEDLNLRILMKRIRCFLLVVETFA